VPELSSTLRRPLTWLRGGWFFVLAVFLKAYSLGGGTYTGIEAVSNNINMLKEPRVRTGQWTMFLMALSLSITAGGIILLYLLWDVVTSQTGETLNAVVFGDIIDSPDSPGASHALLTIVLVFEGALPLSPRTRASWAARPCLPTWPRPHKCRPVQRAFLAPGDPQRCAAYGAAAAHLRGRKGGWVVGGLYTVNVFYVHAVAARTDQLLVEATSDKRARRLMLCARLRRQYRGDHRRAFLQDGRDPWHHVMWSHRAPDSAPLFAGANRPGVQGIGAADPTRVRTPASTPRSRPPFSSAQPRHGWIPSSGSRRYRGISRICLLSVGTVDSQSYTASRRCVRCSTRRARPRCPGQFVHCQGKAAWQVRRLRGDRLVELEKRRSSARGFPNSVFFEPAVFENEHWWNRWLHSQTPLAIQRVLNSR
jgi:hypothetical protein